MMRRITTMLLAACAASVFWTADAVACSCMPRPDVHETLLHLEPDQQRRVLGVRACGEHDFQLRSSARAWGRVVDAAGRPVAGVDIDAVAAELAAHQPPPYQHRVRTAADGRFSFDDLPPGTYVFGVNLTRDHPQRPRGTPVFVPGTTDLRQASIFELAPGDATDAGILRVLVP